MISLGSFAVRHHGGLLFTHTVCFARTVSRFDVANAMRHKRANPSIGFHESCRQVPSFQLTRHWCQTALVML